MSGERFNIGADELNVRLLDLANSVRDRVGVKSDIEWYGDPDVRSYKVSFKKSLQELKFKAKISVEEGIKEIVEKLKSGELTDQPQMHTVNYYKSIVSARDTTNKYATNYLNKVL